jgi:hypothetical protein
MRIRNRLSFLAIPWIAMTVWQSGCQSQPELNPPAEPPKSAVISDYQDVAEAALGKPARVAAQGDLAKNGRLEVLVVDGSSASARDGQGAGSTSSPLLVTRAAILQKNGEKWVELLRCDEHLKNSQGYLQGTPLNPVTGWKLTFKVDARRGLDLLFTPMNVAANQAPASNEEGLEGRGVEVRWNKGTGRYQSLDSSGDIFLEEAPALEIQHSILK